MVISEYADQWNNVWMQIITIIRHRLQAGNLFQWVIQMPTMIILNQVQLNEFFYSSFIGEFPNHTVLIMPF